jgi:hypothetical protein
VTAIDGMADFEGEVTGGLTILAWFHGRDLIARVTRTPDVMAQVPTSTVVTTEGQLHQTLDAWLAEIKRRGMGDR